MSQQPFSYSPLLIHHLGDPLGDPYLSILTMETTLGSGGSSSITTEGDSQLGMFSNHTCDAIVLFHCVYQLLLMLACPQSKLANFH